MDTCMLNNFQNTSKVVWLFLAWSMSYEQSPVLVSPLPCHHQQSNIPTIPPSVFLFTRQSGWWLDIGHYGESHETPRDGVNTFGGLRNICLVIQRGSGQHGSKRQEWQTWVYLQMLFEMKSVECSSSIIIRWSWVDTDGKPQEQRISIICSL